MGFSGRICFVFNGARILSTNTGSFCNSVSMLFLALRSQLFTIKRICDPSLILDRLYKAVCDSSAEFLANQLNVFLMSHSLKK